MGLGLWFTIGIVFAVWSYFLAESKGKPSPILWGIFGFFFNVIIVAALLAVHSKAELKAMLNESQSVDKSYKKIKFDGFYLVPDKSGSVVTRSGSYDISIFERLSPDCKVADDYESQQWVELSKYEVHKSHIEKI